MTISGAADTKGDNKATLGASINSGYLFPVADVNGVPQKLGTVGHVFGRLGQGTDTLPSNTTPFRWVDLTKSGKKAEL